MAFPANPADLEVCIAYGANLASDLTTLTYSGNLATTLVQPRVLITRGRIGGASRTQPTTIDLGLKNPNGIFSPRNITGPHYGQLRRNTPVRVRLDPGTGMVTRGIAYMPDWPTRWTGPDINDRIPMQAAGALRRLGVGRDARSALRRSLTASLPVAYWPVEDGRDSTTLASALPGGPPAAVMGGVSLGSTGPVGASSFATAVTPAAGSGGAPTSGNLVFPGLGGSLLTFWVKGTPWESPPTGGVQVTVTHRVTFAGGPSNGLSYADIDLLGYTVGGFTPPVGYRVRFFTALGGAIGTDIYTGAAHPTWSPFDGQWHEVQLSMAQNGTSIDTALYVDGVLGGSLTMSFQAWTSFRELTAGVKGYYQDAANAFLAPYQAPYSIGSVSAHGLFGPSPISDSFYQAGIGYPGELAATRVARLCAEDGVTVDVTAGATEPMGPQLPGTLPDLLRECEDADEATLIERRTGVLGFDPRRSRYNDPVVLTIPYLSVADLQPDDGDRDLRNYVTVTRIGGSSATVERVTGPLGTDKATGVDRYPDPFSRSLSTDTQTAHHAGWLSMMGTVDEPRYTIGLNLRAHPELVTQWLACDIGSRILVTNPPAIQVGPAPLDLIIEGYEELLDGVEWYVTLYALPYRPYEVFQIETGTGNRSRIAAGVSTTNLAYAATATSLSVTSAVVRWIDSATYAAKFPIVVEIAGEVMTCTAIGNAVADTFSRTVAGGWGTEPTTGVAYTTSPGADHSVSTGGGRQSLGTVNALRSAFLDIGSTDVDYTIDVSLPPTNASGATITQWVCGRVLDGSNYYAARLDLSTSGAVSLGLYERVAGTLATLVGQTVLAAAHVSGEFWRVRLQVSGSAIRAKAWIPAAQAEPDSWQVSTTDTSLTTGTQIAVMSRLETGNLNTLPVIVSWDLLAVTNPQTFTVARGLHGVSKALPINSTVQIWRAPCIAL